jgi:phosphate transport system substrate-binding protein
MTFPVRRLLAVVGAVALAALVLAGSEPAMAKDHSYQLIEGTGSTWSQNAINQWIADVSSVGIEVAYGGGGSSKGRRDFGEGTVDFAVTEIPFQGRDPRTGQTDSANGRPYAYMPVVAGGTSFMYHLEIGGRLYTGLRLSGETIAKIFTGKITNWDDPEITQDNNGFKFPSTKIIPVVRSDGSGTSAQFTAWMDNQYPSLWRPFCGCKGLTSYYPIKHGFVAKDGSVGVAGHISASYGNGTIGYVEYSYALNDNYPVAKVLNKAGYYVQPTAYNVAVALTKAKINEDKGSSLYLTQELDGVYNYSDPRTYPLSSYSYMVVPTSKNDPRMNEAKGRTLGDFAYYFLCQGQQEAPALGYSPLPLNLVKAGFAQVRKIPWADTAGKNPSTCNNPTFDHAHPNSNLLAEAAPQPDKCDKLGQGPCGIVVAPAAPSTGTTPSSSSPTSGQTPAGGAGPSAAPKPGIGAKGGSPPGGGGTLPIVGGAVPTAGADPSVSAAQYFGTPTTISQYRVAGNNRTLGVLVALELLTLLVIPPILVKMWRSRRPKSSP